MYSIVINIFCELRIGLESIMANRNREQAAEAKAMKTVERVLSGAVSKVLAQLVSDQPSCVSKAI